jgi:two-component system C4-dicarboxylate transport response regulator DctD
LLVAASRYGKSAPAIEAQQIHQLMAHDWPGNVRELRNAAERFVLLGHLSQFGESNNVSSKETSLAQQVAEFEKSIIEQALNQCDGSIKATMEHLQLARKTLYDKMQKHGLDKNNYKGE